MKRIHILIIFTLVECGSCFCVTQNDYVFALEPEIQLQTKFT